MAVRVAIRVAVAVAAIAAVGSIVAVAASAAAVASVAAVGHGCGEGIWVWTCRRGSRSGRESGGSDEWGRCRRRCRTKESGWPVARVVMEDGRKWMWEGEWGSEAKSGDFSPCPPKKKVKLWRQLRGTHQPAGVHAANWLPDTCQVILSGKIKFARSLRRHPA